MKTTKTLWKHHQIYYLHSGQPIAQVHHPRQFIGSPSLSPAPKITTTSLETQTTWTTPHYLHQEPKSSRSKLWFEYAGAIKGRQKQNVSGCGSWFNHWSTITHHHHYGNDQWICILSSPARISGLTCYRSEHTIHPDLQPCEQRLNPQQQPSLCPLPPEFATHRLSTTRKDPINPLSRHRRTYNDRPFIVETLITARTAGWRSLTASPQLTASRIHHHILDLKHPSSRLSTSATKES